MLEAVTHLMWGVMQLAEAFEHAELDRALEPRGDSAMVAGENPARADRRPHETARPPAAEDEP